MYSISEKKKKRFVRMCVCGWLGSGYVCSYMCVCVLWGGKAGESIYIFQS